LAVVEIRPEGFVVLDKLVDISDEALQAQTGAKLSFVRQ